MSQRYHEKTERLAEVAQVNNKINCVTDVVHAIFYCLPGISVHLFLMDYQKYTSQTVLSPIVSRCDGPTDHLSFYITHFIQPLANNLPSHIKDTKYFLNLIEEFLLFPTNAFLVTADATSLYTNIPHYDGITAVIHFMEECKYLLPTNWPRLHIVPAILNLILKHSTFSFMDTHIYQILGTFMGTRITPSPLCQSFHGWRRMYHHPSTTSPNILLETLHWRYFFIFLGSQPSSNLWWHLWIQSALPLNIHSPTPNKLFPP